MESPGCGVRPWRVLMLATLGSMVAVGAVAAANLEAAAANGNHTEVVAVPGTDPALPGVVPETTVAPTTTTAAPAPAPTTTTAPPPAPTTTVAPAPPPPPPPPVDPMTRVRTAYDASVPAAWRNAIAVKFELIDGNTSWASHNGTIQIGSAHYSGSDAMLRVTIAHEFGHLIAFKYGSYEYNGAAPEGWPAYSNRPEEAWGDCVARAFTGISDPSHGLPECTGNSYSWTVDWLAPGPSAHPRTAP